MILMNKKLLDIQDLRCYLTILHLYSIFILVVYHMLNNITV